MSDMWFVYYLADPGAPRHPRYIGMTSNPAERERRHAGHNSTNGRLADWKSDLAGRGLRPKLIVVATVTTKHGAREAEWRLSRRWRRRGLCDCNGERDGRLDALRLEWEGKRAHGVGP